ncbi:MAG TPA: class I SAM-dependent methyltransferase [Acetobacteraceae bacterium]|jgi:SAM-dependent methyltransferase|nr:class I SAM-dependent methyltransferase [Acetobacteraceae bacterium]
MTDPTCRLCGAVMHRDLIDLGETPLANCYVTRDEAARGIDQPYLLRVMVCDRCLLVQVTETIPPDAIFAADYAYFSSFSVSWVAHAGRYAQAMIERFGLAADSLVAEVASNDGYLLQHFRAAGVPVLGIEPAANVASAARRIGVRTEEKFFGADTAPALVARYGRADLMTANNVLAHVPDLPDFVAGFADMLAPNGVVTFEFPHLLRLLEQVQFDTIYHEHFSYLSLLVVEPVLEEVGLRVFDVECPPTHGGSLRVFACHLGAHHAPCPGLDAVRTQEKAAGLHRPETYDSFSPKVARIRDGFRRFVAAEHAQGRRLAGYGAAAKGNTFLNFCGITADDMICVADRNPAKQGKLLPGSHIPVVSPDELADAQPDDVVVLPWNIAEEVAAELKPLRASGTKLWVAMPEARML